MRNDYFDVYQKTIFREFSVARELSVIRDPQTFEWRKTPTNSADVSGTECTVVIALYVVLYVCHFSIELYNAPRLTQEKAAGGQCFVSQRGLTTFLVTLVTIIL
jgi:hypothetical protein